MDLLGLKAISKDGNDYLQVDYFPTPVQAIRILQVWNGNVWRGPPNGITEKGAGVYCFMLDPQESIMKDPFEPYTSRWSNGPRMGSHRTSEMLLTENWEIYCTKKKKAQNIDYNQKFYRLKVAHSVHYTKKIKRMIVCRLGDKDEVLEPGSLIIYEIEDGWKEEIARISVPIRKGKKHCKLNEDDSFTMLLSQTQSDAAETLRDVLESSYHTHTDFLDIKPSIDEMETSVEHSKSSSPKIVDEISLFSKRASPKRMEEPREKRQCLDAQFTAQPERPPSTSESLENRSTDLRHLFQNPGSLSPLMRSNEGHISECLRFLTSVQSGSMTNFEQDTEEKTKERKREQLVDPVLNQERDVEQNGREVAKKGGNPTEQKPGQGADRYDRFGRFIADALRELAALDQQEVNRTILRTEKAVNDLRYKIYETNNMI